MYKFHKLYQGNTNIKCQFPDCQQHAIWLEKMPLYDILLCEQHKAAQEYIHVANNLPHDYGDTFLMTVETPGNPDEETT